MLMRVLTKIESEEEAFVAFTSLNLEISHAPSDCSHKSWCGSAVKTERKVL